MCKFMCVWLCLCANVIDFIVESTQSCCLKQSAHTSMPRALTSLKYISSEWRVSWGASTWIRTTNYSVFFHDWKYGFRWNRQQIPVFRCSYETFAISYFIMCYSRWRRMSARKSYVFDARFAFAKCLIWLRFVGIFSFLPCLRSSCFARRIFSSDSFAFTSFSFLTFHSYSHISYLVPIWENLEQCAMYLIC